MAASKREIRGVVAKVLNTTQLVINKGKKHGVALGMIFDVLDKEATEIMDPETNELLGSIDRPKVSVKVVIVENSLSLAETYRYERINEGGSGSALGSMFAPPKYVDVQETFKASEKAWEDLPPEDSYVKVGDPIRLSSDNTVKPLKIEDVLD